MANTHGKAPVNDSFLKLELIGLSSSGNTILFFMITHLNLCWLGYTKRTHKRYNVGFIILIYFEGQEVA